MKPRSKILIIAGSDSSGGAGIQADVKTATCLGIYAMTSVTAVTIQNTKGVKSIVPIPPDQIYKQIVYTAKDIKPDSIKIGMLHSTKVINNVMKSLQKIRTKKVILDPVMVAKGGSKLINEKAIKLMKKKLLKKVLLITPNVPEAEILTGLKISTKEEMIIASKKLIKSGAKNVLIKGGHLNSKKVYDIFVNKNEIKIFSSNRFKTKNTHGTGCTLSTAITSFLSCGKTLKKSCELGIKYVNSAILTNPKIGKGHGPINHLNSIKLKKIFK
ncbi:bifunctional hydroxymethylpyrimidine kinase/phosphomethylpyrimidine kinase [Candidatus Pelagibacter communis]|uniref:bifunctional hydroxymethylpyrimidine kinase/phosphomethylpyrimidine kinase n=1 Tax=Pelagibacter ubique TaxID=198252 RepID=UPI00094C3CE7|nr:bifunctional hydroxymethylpyrimidine kinase/phosphomethylpyrimidine kinase [Candidatus Pelagibacter ubique]